MKSHTVVLALALSAANAAPIQNPDTLVAVVEKRQFGGFDLSSLTSGLTSGGSSGLGSLGSASSLGGGSLPSASSLGSLGSASSFGSLGSLGSTATTGNPLDSLSSLSGGASTTGASSAVVADTTAAAATDGTTAATSSDATTTTTSSSTGGSSAGLSNSGNCKAVTLLFARGTSEMGTMGTVIGPPLAEALGSAVGSGNLAVEGVSYPADFMGNTNMGATGGRAMASQASTILAACPSTKLVLAGYSQGAMAVHNALSAQGLPGSSVAAIVAFGDPFNGQSFQGVDSSKVKEFCGSADTLCLAGGRSGSGSSHLSYGGDARAAAEFIAGVVGA